MKDFLKLVVAVAFGVWLLPSLFFLVVSLLTPW